MRKKQIFIAVLLFMFIGALQAQENYRLTLLAQSSMRLNITGL